MYSNEVNALISLIEDPDETIYTQVRNELRNYGEAIIPQLEHYWELQDFGPLFQTRLEELISSIQYEGVYNRLKIWNIHHTRRMSLFVRFQKSVRISGSN
jgi:hypothetical protein